MHYYKKNIGDYHKKAGRLSMLEHGAYTLLMDSCYDREQFPTLDEAIDWCWARTQAEVDAVKFVLSKFFTLENGIYVQQRIKDELEAYRVNAENNRRIAQEREANKKKNRESKNDTCTNRDEERKNRERIVSKSQPNHKPLTTNQEPLKKSKAGKPPVDDGGANLGENQNSLNNPVDQQADSVGGHGSAGGLPPADQQNPDQQACMRVGDQVGDEHCGQQAGSPVGGHVDCPVQRIVDLYHEALPELPRVKVMTERRKTQIRQRWREHRSMQALDRWSAFFAYVRESDFLMGRVNSGERKPFVADLEFLTTQSKFVSVIEGKYHDNRA